MTHALTLSRRQLFQAAAGLSLSTAAPVWAQTYPSRPVKLLSGASAGSASDIIARAVAEKIQAELGQPVVVENRMGASGTIAVQAMLAAPADGHTVSVYTAAHTVVPLLSKVPYDPLKDIAAVIPLAVVPNVLVVAPSKGYKTVQDLVAAAKAKPGALNYASVGAGTATSMSAEKFRAATGIDAVHVPFKGSPEAINETLTGRIDFFFAPLVSALPMSPEQFDAMIREEMVSNAAIIKAAGIKIE